MGPTFNRSEESGCVKWHTVRCTQYEDGADYKNIKISQSNPILKYTRQLSCLISATKYDIPQGVISVWGENDNVNVKMSQCTLVLHHMWHDQEDETDVGHIYLGVKSYKRWQILLFTFIFILELQILICSCNQKFQLSCNDLDQNVAF